VARRGGRTHDVVVVGAGSGGLTTAVGLAGLGRSVALVEADRVGGDCTNVGCIPSKRLIHLSRDPALQADPAALLAAVRATRDALAQREEREFGHWKGIELVHGSARVEAPGRVVVRGGAGDRMLTARDVVVATGSRPRRIAIPGLPPERLLTNETLFEIPRAPSHLAIVGAGPIAMEMACAFARIGTRVTVMGRDARVLPQADPDASQVLAAALDEQGVRVLLRTQVRGYDDAGALLVEGPSGPGRVEGVDRVLVAVGREPVTDAVAGLVETRDDGILVDGWGRTSRRGVWAVGDVTPRSHQTHAADAGARRVIQAIAFPWIPTVGRPPAIPSAVFSDPEVAWVGAPVERIRERFGAEGIVRVRVELADTDRGLTDDVRRGFVAIDVLRLTGRVLAATLVGPRVSELLPVLTLAVSRRMSLLRLGRVVHAYPTLAGAIGRAADDFAVDTLLNARREIAAAIRTRSAAVRGPLRHGGAG
jgi:pyruvate/2-oxoglutarate dehydrogenase complex dihydrolipoamide dehydrogenase (E3) component